MIAVWYDPDCDQIWITDAERPYPPRSLVAFIDPASNRVGIRSKFSTGSDIMTPYTNLTDQNGNGFASAAEAKAYLDGEFAKQRAIDIPAATAMAGADLPAGMPVAVSRATGALLAARADTHALAFVIGLAATPVASGFSGQATRNALTLADWSAIVGTPGLALGQPYFLAPTGGLTTAPVLTPGLSLVRVGNATGPQTLAPVLAAPILL